MLTREFFRFRVEPCRGWKPCHPVCTPLQLPCGTVGDAGSLLQSGNPLSAAQQRRRPGSLDAPPAASARATAAIVMSSAASTITATSYSPQE